MAREKTERFGLSGTARRILGRSALIGGISLASISLVCFGLYKVTRYVDRNVAYSSEPPKVVLKNRPAWMSDLVAEQICAAAQPSGAHSALDSRLPRNVNVMLDNNIRTRAWIRKINQVKLVYGQAPGDTMVLDCEFRVPVALVRYQDAYYLVDGEGTALPERYTSDQVARVIFGPDGKMNIRVVEGLRSDRPMPGQKWVGEDLAAALDMIKVLHGKPYAEEIVKVDVSNFGGRQDQREAQLVLGTRQNTRILWGRPVQSNDIAEVSASEKLKKLELIHRQYRRIDAGQPWLDIRFDQVYQPDSRSTASTQ